MFTMETYHLVQTHLWSRSKYSPPSRPLPPLPYTAYPVRSGAYHHELLLTHRVPSPSLRFDMMDPVDEQSSYTSSTPSSTFSSLPSYRDSTSSLIEFTQALLPPISCPDRSFAGVKPVDCRSQGEIINPRSTLSISPISKRSATPEQLHQLCFELDELNLGRRDSAMFDTTLPKTIKPLRRCTESDLHVISPPGSTSIPTIATNHLESGAAMYQVTKSPPLPPTPRSTPVETSFIEWDDEEPRLLRMKKSLADLKTGYRLRPTVTTVDRTRPMTLPSIVATPRPSTIVITSPIALLHSSPDATRSRTPPSVDIKLAKSKSVVRRRTFSILTAAKRLSRPVMQRQISSGSTATVYSLKRKRVTTACSVTSAQTRRHGFSTLSSWMRKAAKYIPEARPNVKRVLRNGKNPRLHVNERD